MRYLLLTFIILLSLNGCQDKAQENKEQALRDAKIAQGVRADLLSEFEAKEIALINASKENEAKIIQQARKALLEEQEAEAKALQSNKISPDTNTSKLSKMGVDVVNGVITIDTNSTKDYFRVLSKNMGDKIKKMKEDFKKGAIETKEAGIEISEEHINIDLNKTKNLIEAWNKKINTYIEEFDALTKDIEVNTTTEGN